MAAGLESESNTEESIGSCYTVVYDFAAEDKNWVVAGNGGWSELHVCQDKSDGSYRILAWTHESQDVLVNCNLDHACEYKEKSENFHSFKDGQGNRKGFGFHKSDRNLQSAKDFLEIVKTVITELRRQNQINNPGSLQDRTQSLIPSVPILPQEQRAPPEIDASGQMKILEGRAAKQLQSDFLITDPHQVQRQAHVEYSEETGGYVYHNAENLPEGWLKVANMRFKVKPATLPSVHIENSDYGIKIPLILEKMKNRIIDLGGLSETGIFRIAPDSAECEWIKEKMNTGSDWFSQDCDVNVIANLLKVWFRDLPNPILNIVPNSVIELNQTADKVAAAMDKFPPLEKGLLLWLWDFCVEVQGFSAENKMTIQNLGIVIGPNLFNTEQFQNPMKAMEFSGKVVTFFQKGVEWRKSLKASN